MDLTTILSNDQIAVLGCFGALAASGLFAAVSFHFGPAGKKSLQKTPQLRVSPAIDRPESKNTRKAA
ncbi:MAG: hypothetical protein RIK87_24040 [Fuerstiella sp.]